MKFTLSSWKVIKLYKMDKIGIRIKLNKINKKIHFHTVLYSSDSREFIRLQHLRWSLETIDFLLDSRIKSFYKLLSDTYKKENQDPEFLDLLIDFFSDENCCRIFLLDEEEFQFSLKWICNFRKDSVEYKKRKIIFYKVFELTKNKFYGVIVGKSIVKNIDHEIFFDIIRYTNKLDFVFNRMVTIEVMFPNDHRFQLIKLFLEKYPEIDIDSEKDKPI